MVPDPQKDLLPSSFTTPVTASDRNRAMDELDALKRARFDLLSAYLDGEVTAAERKLVETWLETDPEIQHLHARLVALHYGFQHLPVPEPQESVEQTLAQVLDRIDRRPKLGLIWGGLGTAIAAAFMGAVMGSFSGGPGVPQLAQRPDVSPEWQTQGNPIDNFSPGSSSPKLMIALERPPIDIPRAPTALPVNQPSPEL